MKLGCICGCFNRAFDAGTMDQIGFLRQCASMPGVGGAEMQDIHFPQTRPSYLRTLRRTAAELGLAIIGIGVHNDFGRAAATWRQSEIAKVKQWIEVADDLNYANGIGVSPDQKTLYVSETVGNCILKFTINDDGSLSHRSNFALLNLLTKNKNDSWWLGPDSMKIDNKGNIYVAQWFGGKILKISPDGKLLHVFEIAVGDGTTNVAFGQNEEELYVTVVKDPKDPQAKGSIVKIKNVK